MFVGVTHVTLDIPAAGSLKAKRQVLRRVTDRLKARFNVAVAEVEDNDVWNRAVIALSVLGNERRHVNEMLDKIFFAIDEMYVAPVSSREMEMLSFGEDLFGTPALTDAFAHLTIPKGERSLAEVEGLGSWEERHARQLPPPSPSAPSRKGAKKKDIEMPDARALARSLRNRREWEK